MRIKPSGADDERATTTADEDARDQAAVLRHVLSLYPETLTLDELFREMIGVSSSGSSERDAVERAVRDLAAVGLLHEEGSRVFPTRAAVTFHDLYEA
ncbi:MAG TPA: hypothetical protein VFJ76_03230 [Solirubrobacterales bacterium]|nr:hypothetical protein [Solirubrobacterales bacterium]